MKYKQWSLVIGESRHRKTIRLVIDIAVKPMLPFGLILLDYVICLGSLLLYFLFFQSSAFEQIEYENMDLINNIYTSRYREVLLRTGNKFVIYNSQFL